MEIAPTEEKMGRDEFFQLRDNKLFLIREACLQFEIELISLEHVLYNQMWDEDYFPRSTTRELCTYITKLREHINRKYYDFEVVISKAESLEIMYASRDLDLDEIIN
jgi:hypothetical protein